MQQFPGFFNIFNTPHKQPCKIIASLLLAAYFLFAIMPSVCHAESVKTSLILPVALTELTALPDSSIAVVTGTGLQAPAANGNTTPSAPVVLWDELRPVNQQSTLSSGTVTITVNGAVQ